MSGEISTAIIVVILVAACVLGVKSYVKKLRSGCCGGGGEASEKKVKVADKNKEHYPYAVCADIDGMVCGNCATRVENALNRMDGVWAKVDLSRKNALIRSKTPVETDVIKDTVREAGYTVLKVSKV